MSHDQGFLDGNVFAVGDTPYCCWDWNPVARTLEFLDGLDSTYFGSLAEILLSAIGTEQEFVAATALRVTYHQSLETLMSLLGAYAQAPTAVPAWIAKCSTSNLQEVISRIQTGSQLLTQRGPSRVSFDTLSTEVHRHAWTDEIVEPSTAERFSRLWSRLAGDFLDAAGRAEYNALKHGNRVRPGGFTMAIGVEESPGVPAPQDAMRSLGGSRFGSTFHVAERLGDSKSHIRMRRTSVNWSPKAVAQRQFLVSLSIANVAGALRCGLGVDPTTIQFHRPTPATVFEDVWKGDPTLKQSTMDAIIQIDPEDQLSAAELAEMLSALGGPSGPRPSTDP